ncbi:chemotaxis protein CheW [Spirulina subsalsa]|uniref:chemotaxis protein CheW n=1 Tax=Spirulina subsalsa TaxID=54311 RepID=UPI00030DB11E|nr:chemotaxis protein CheW [Spirulina subsalsa]
MTSSPQRADSVKVIVFPLGNHLFSLPMKAVLKIYHCPPDAKTGFDEVGLIDLEGQTVLLLPLEALLKEQETGEEDVFLTPISQAERPFLILIKNPRQQLCGIQVAELPNMIDLPLHIIQPLPPSTKQTSPAQFAQYVALWQSEQGKKPIFLLDIGRVMQEINP